MRLRNNALVAFLLAGFVLFAQCGASLHALSHALREVAESRQASCAQQAPIGHESCEQCLAFAAAAAGLLRHASFALPLFGNVASASLFVMHIERRALAAYYSRGPPSLIV